MNNDTNSQCKILPIFYFLLAALVLHAIVRHLAVPIPTSSALPLLAYSLRSFFISCAIFGTFTAVPVSIGAIIWLVSGRKNKHCASTYINRGLLGGFLISMLMVYFSWYGSYRAAQYTSFSPESSNKNSVVAEQVYA